MAEMRRNAKACFLSKHLTLSTTQNQWYHDPGPEGGLKRREELLVGRVEYTMEKGDLIDKLYEAEDMTPFNMIHDQLVDLEKTNTCLHRVEADIF